MAIILVITVMYILSVIVILTASKVCIALFDIMGLIALITEKAVIAVKVIADAISMWL